MDIFQERLIKSRAIVDTTEDLLHLVEGYGLVRETITRESTFIGKSLFEANTAETEFWVLGIERGKKWISLPRSSETINEGDKLIVYGNIDMLRNIFTEKV